MSDPFAHQSRITQGHCCCLSGRDFCPAGSCSWTFRRCRDNRIVGRRGTRPDNRPAVRGPPGWLTVSASVARRKGDSHCRARGRRICSRCIERLGPRPQITRNRARTGIPADALGRRSSVSERYRHRRAHRSGTFWAHQHRIVCRNAQVC